MLEARQERAGRSALKSYAEQTGLSVEQVTAAEVRTVGAELHTFP